MYIGLWPGEAKQGGRRSNCACPFNNVFGGELPLKNNQPCDVIFVIIIKSCSFKWRNMSAIINFLVAKCHYSLKLGHVDS